MKEAAGTSPLPRAWLCVGLLWGAGALNYLDRVMITSMRASVVGAVPMSEAQFGLLTSVFLWVYAVFSPGAGFIADRFSRTRVIVGSLLAWSIITWLTGYANTVAELVTCRALLGVSQACYIPAALALIADYHPGSTRSFATGVHMSGIMIGSGLSGLGGWVADHYAWSDGFIAFGAAGVAYAFVVAGLMRDPAPSCPAAERAVASAPERIRFGAALASLLSGRGFLIALVFWGLYGIAGWAVFGWMPTYLKERFELSQGEAGLSATGYLQAAALVGVLVGGFWADRWSRRNARGRILVPALGLFLAAPGILVAASTPTLAVALAGLVVFGFGRAFTDSNMMPVLCLVADARYRATGYGVLNFLSCVVGGLAIYAGGALRDAHVDVSRIFQFAALSLAACGLLLLCLRPTASVR